jgi:hypothetical protein
MVTSGKTPYVRFDRNSYSIPHTHVRRPLTLLASPTTVRVIAGTEEIARHSRSYDTAHVIEQEAHVVGVVAATRQANPSSARDRLRLAVPAATTLLERLATRGESLRYPIARLLTLLDDYGPQELAAAIDRALERDALGAGAIAHILETHRRQRGLKPPIPRPACGTASSGAFETRASAASNRWPIGNGTGPRLSIGRLSSASSRLTFSRSART